MNYKSLCLDILDLHYAIRFAVIVSINSSKILAAESKHEVTSLLTSKESELSIMQALIRMAMKKTMEKRLGKVIYTTTVYEKLKVATISMYNYTSRSNENNNKHNNNNNKNGIVKEEREVEEDKGNEGQGSNDDDDLLLMVSFEKEADHDAIITRKILPFLNKVGKGLVMAG